MLVPIARQRRMIMRIGNYSQVLGEFQKVGDLLIIKVYLTSYYSFFFIFWLALKILYSGLAFGTMAQSTSDPPYKNQELCNNSSDSAANSNSNNQNDESDKEKNFAWIYCRSLTKYRQSGVTPPVVDPGSMDSEHQNEREFNFAIRRNRCYS